MFSEVFDKTVLSVIIVWVVLGGFVRRYRRRRRKVNTKSLSVLLSYYTEGVELIPLKKGLMNDLHYTAIGALAALDGGFSDKPALLYRIELPFHSQLHLLGIPKQTKAVQLDPTGGKSLMERVELEGDYDKYFSLYTEKGMQAQTRYILDPRAMAFTADFCQSHNWEIVGGDLYFVQATANAPGDPTSMADDITRFVKEITPAVAIPLTDAELQLRTPYNEERRTDLICPLCGQTLKNEQSYLFCPAGHGCLAKGSVLAQINRGTVVLPFTSLKGTVERTYALQCPSCGHAMHQMPYNGGKTIIDSCSHCPYRWLDAGELQPIKQLP